MLDTEKNIIDNQFLCFSLEAYLDERNKNCRTRGQKQKNLVFSFRMVDSDLSQPMEIVKDLNESSNCHGVPMKCESSLHNAGNSIDLDTDDIHMGKEAVESPPKVQETEIQEEVEMSNVVEQGMHSIPVRFLEADSKREIMVEHYTRRVTIDRIVEEFVRRNEMNMHEVIFTDEKDQLISVEHRPLELYLDCDQIELDIYFKVEENPKSRKTMKRPKSIDQSTTAKNQRQKRQFYLTFKDQTAKRDSMDIDFDDDEEFSVAIERISGVMELDPLKSHFFDLNGMFYSSF